MRTIPTTERQRLADRERLNQLMEAIALIIARRQMKSRWAPTAQRALPAVTCN